MFKSKKTKFKVPARKLTPDSIRMKYETVHRERMLALPAYKKVLRELSKNSTDRIESQRNLLMRTGMRVSPKSAPEVFEYLERCRELVSLKDEFEVYLTKDMGGENAYVFHENGKIIVGLVNGLTNMLSSTELASVLAHEVGHAIMHHNKDSLAALGMYYYFRDYDWEIPKIKGVSGDDFYDLVDEVSLYLQFQELSADRLGLLLCQDVDACITGSMKLAAGKVGDSIAFHTDQLLEQGHELVETGNYSLDFLSSHPDPPLRAIALELFSKSKLCSFFNSNGGQLTHKKVDDTVYDWLLPPTQEEQKPEREAVNIDEWSPNDVKYNFVLNVGSLVAYADGKFTASEQKLMDRLLGKGTAEALIRSSDSVSELDVKTFTKKLAKKVKGMHGKTKAMILRRLVDIAKADRKVTQSELDVIEWAAELIDAKHLYEKIVKEKLDSYIIQK